MFSNLTATKEQYEFSLKDLTLWLAKHHNQKPIVLIDEYDTPVHEAHSNKYYDKLMHFMRPFLGGGLKDNTSLERCVVTGILRISKESIFSDVNHIISFTPLDRQYSDKFGLLEHEVVSLLQQCGMHNDLEGFRRWYNGYTIGGVTSVYNPWSVINCIAKNGQFASYWANSSGNQLIKDLITQGPFDLKEDLELLLEGKTIEKPIDEHVVLPGIENNSDAIWALLLCSGYLTLAAPPRFEEGTPHCSLRIPNEELRAIYTRMISSWFKEALISSHYVKMFQSLMERDVPTFTALFQEFLLARVSAFGTAPESEKAYHMLLLGILGGMGGYRVQSNRESGLGRYDISLIPRDPQGLGIVIELKRATTVKGLKTAAATAVKQIVSKRYATELRAQGVKRVLEIGMAFCGKRVVAKQRA